MGAGIAGLSTAYRLARQGVRVLVLDDGPLGGGQTACTTAHLASVIDDRFSEVERVRGEEGARLAWQAHAAAIDAIEETVQRENIDCDFCRVDGYLFAPPGDSTQVLDQEEKTARKLGVPVERVPRVPLPAFDTGAALRFPRQGQFHPLRYLEGLARAIRAAGGMIVTGVHVTKIVGGLAALVETRDGNQVQANAVVVATNSPINDRLTMHTKQAPYITYVVTLSVAAGSVLRALYWDTQDPYHYVRLTPGEAGEELLIVGGEDHKTGQASDHAERFARLEAWARERFPDLGPVRNRWAGQVLETLDGLAYIGPNPADADNIYIATGDSGMGMTHGTIAGLLLTDLILGRDNPWTNLFDPSRKPVATLGTFLSENLSASKGYLDYVTGGEVSSTEEIHPGCGAIVREGLSKHAAYRDERGELHVCSAVCPHLGGVVRWNDAEKTWDCPVHGSRFSAEGQVVQGPANSDLAPIEQPASR